jgi:hypothetical protein
LSEADASRWEVKEWGSPDLTKVSGATSMVGELEMHGHRLRRHMAFLDLGLGQRWGGKEGNSDVMEELGEVDAEKVEVRNTKQPW